MTFTRHSLLGLHLNQQRCSDLDHHLGGLLELLLGFLHLLLELFGFLGFLLFLLLFLLHVHPHEPKLFYKEFMLSDMFLGTDQWVGVNMHRAYEA